MTNEAHVAAWRQAMARAGLISPQRLLTTPLRKASVIAGPRHPSVPDLKELDMMFKWSVHQSGGRAVAETECLYVQDTELAMAFAVKAFAFHGWEIERGAITQREDTWALSLVFIHAKLRHGKRSSAGKKRAI